MGVRVSKKAPFSLAGMSQQEMDVVRVGLFIVANIEDDLGMPAAPFYPKQEEVALARRMYWDIVATQDLLLSDEKVG